ncbi:inositol monophosphatase family protein [Paractinoplanes atraurantiacus]|uniref:Myo-inositol-1(Or 4)-monophosphatase n=1 Tax=Paractinoplanes atraurantiacus TaxID=1036182 RepID=A0A285IBI8_9ACTN|nr:inositol monophosphatase family protein [Actinoplanes atraurantiacus]SNY45293.1 myo-inositol-1(or 4)-monophosphatase [Actinoplanes atraurantiacus]
MITDGELAIAAARAGARVVLAHFGAEHDRVDKGGGDFATAADLQAERAIIDLLSENRPGDAVLGEETGHSGVPADRTWMVDPLCGTLNYAVRSQLVAVNVALREDGEVTTAACADPFTGEVFWTNGDSACVRRESTDEKLSPSASSRLVDVNLDPPFPNDPRFRAADLLANRDFAARFRPRVVSTTLAVTWVAAGRRAAYVTDGHLRDSVHFAAGIALARAAGCVVTALDGGPAHSGPGGLIVAADARTHTDLLTMIGF